MVLFINHLRNAMGLHRTIGRAALQASALVVVNRAKLNARGGFKSGAFVTGGWNLITYEIAEEGDEMTARVGSTLKHFAFWELGHHNLFTRKYEREPWLQPALFGTRREQEQAALRAAKQVARDGEMPQLRSMYGLYIGG